MTYSVERSDDAREDEMSFQHLVLFNQLTELYCLLCGLGKARPKIILTHEDWHSAKVSTLN